MRRIGELWKKYLNPLSVRMGLALSFTMVALFAVGIFGTTMYNLVAHRMERMMSESSAAAGSDGNQSGNISERYAASF